MSGDHKTSYRHIIRLAAPIVLGGLAQTIIMATDAFFMAQVSEISLDAVGLAGLFFGTFFILGFGFSIGSQILIARRDGEKKYDDIGKIFDNSLIFLFAASVLMLLVMYWIAPAILKGIIKSDEILHETLIYLQYRSWSIVPALIALNYRGFFIGISKSNIITYSTFAMAAANILLNYGLIFGHFGLPTMGIAGAALASGIAEFVSILAFVIYAKYHQYHKRFHLFALRKFDRKEMSQVVNIASPMMLQHFISHSAWFLFFAIIEQSGHRALAISVLIRMIYMFQMVPFWGLNAAANTLVSFTLGEGKVKEIPKLIKKIILLGIISATVMVSPNLFIPEKVLGLAVSDLSLIMDSIPTLYVVSFSMFTIAIGTILFALVTGSGNTRTALWMEIVIIILYMLMAYVFGIVMQADVHIVWLTEPFYFIIMGIASLLFYKFGNWQNKSI
ncbi:MAG: MATE family efflux transporter [Flavobacteriales bacterium]